MKIKPIHWIGLGVGLAIIALSLIFMGTNLSFLLMGLGVVIAALPFIFTVIKETRDSTEKEEMFLEFSRNLVESVKAGTPISKSIINVKDKDYGVLSENIKKLADQISLGIPLNKALQTFSKDVKHKTISRSLTLIGQAERSGGEIGEILESVTKAVSMEDNLRHERAAGVSTLVVQGYIIFIVFIVIVLVLQFQILPLLSGIAPSLGGGGGVGSAIGIGFLGGGGGAPLSSKDVANSFLYLLLVQGLFSGLTIGKLSSGTVKAGIKHSFALMIMAFFISAVANIIFG